MAIAGSWRSGAVTPSEYAGSTRWGTGINPVHAIRDQGPNVISATKEPIGSTAPSDAIDTSLTDPALYGFEGEDSQFYIGEDYRYLEADHPNWGDTVAGRADRNDVIMMTGTEPDPTGFPSWGPYDDNPVDGFPVSGPPGGSRLRAYSDGAEVENSRAIAVPTQGYTGGWLNKERGELALTSAQDIGDPMAQWALPTAEVQGQGLKSLDNNRATGRGTDDPRSSIQSRTAGMRERVYAKSSGMGGGPGTPDMTPVTQDLPFRPWFFRSAAVPPPPQTTYGTMTGFEALQRVPPADAGELVTTTETGAEVTLSDVTDTDYYS